MLLARCGPQYGRYDSQPAAGDTGPPKLQAEVYLFDARMHRKGKPTSFRLEVYQTDSIIALAGRAYLGKGALKGRLTADSVQLYFPGSNEYLYGPTENVLSFDECVRIPSDLNLLQIITARPDSLGGLGWASIHADYEDADRPRFVLTTPGCLWQMELIYDRQETGWRMRQFLFDDGRGTSVKASRRTYRDRVGVPSTKFQLRVPDDADHVTL